MRSPVPRTSRVDPRADCSLPAKAARANARPTLPSVELRTSPGGILGPSSAGADPPASHHGGHPTPTTRSVPRTATAGRPRPASRLRWQPRGRGDEGARWRFVADYRLFRAAGQRARSPSKTELDPMPRVVLVPARDLPGGWIKSSKDAKHRRRTHAETTVEVVDALPRRRCRHLPRSSSPTSSMMEYWSPGEQAKLGAEAENRSAQVASSRRDRRRFPCIRRYNAQAQSPRGRRSLQPVIDQDASPLARDRRARKSPASDVADHACGGPASASAAVDHGGSTSSFQRGRITPAAPQIDQRTSTMATTDVLRANFDSSTRWRSRRCVLIAVACPGDWAAV